MQIKQIAISICIMSGAVVCQQHACASISQVTNSGKTATLTLPLKATISLDSIMRDSISVMPLSSLYEIVKWDPAGKIFKPHEFLIRVNKDQAVPVLFEIINDQYTCSYYNPVRIKNLPVDIGVVNSGYKYSLSWSGKNVDMGSGRSAIVDDNGAWLSAINGSDKFIDLALNITFPDLSSNAQLMSKGGICRGSVTMLLSNKL